MRINRAAKLQATPRIVGGIEYWHTFKIAAEYDYSPEYIRRLFRQGKITGEKDGQGLWIDLSSFNAYLQEKGGIMSDPEWITLAEAEALVNYDEKWLWLLAKQGKIEGKKAINPATHAEVLYVKRADVLAYAEGRGNTRLEGNIGQILWDTFGHMVGGKRGN